GGDIGQIEEQQARKAGLLNNGIFRGDKHLIWEGGFRVPFIVRWPGHFQEGSVSHRMVNLSDIFATVQELVGGEILPSHEAGPDSYSFYDELVGQKSAGSIRPHMVINNVRGVMAIRKGPWKYIEGVSAAPLDEGARKNLADELQPQLYNLETDISESENLIHKYPEIYEDLQQTLDQIKALGAERLYDE
ncbi:MAG: sulfatase-like hydrolase/transferase, partial [Gammaproteobacteria bacterium]|nr:sulfatase-like hydrolase/transferase [Gammaproteobacteria bacterium]